MPTRVFLNFVAVIGMVLVGFDSLAFSQAVETAYGGKLEVVVRSKLGKPSDGFAGHYGAPTLAFTKKFSGKIKTLIFKKPGGAYYISFEKRPAGWVSICSSWLPEGAEF